MPLLFFHLIFYVQYTTNTLKYVSIIPFLLQAFYPSDTSVAIKPGDRLVGFIFSHSSPQSLSVYIINLDYWGAYSD